MPILAPISAGELIDKITILRVKAQRIGDPAKEANVRKEMALLEATALSHIPPSAEMERLTAELMTVNAALWDVEDGKRDCERRQDFGPEFIRLARAVYFENDERARIKKDLNLALGSALASIGLTIPAVAIVSLATGWTLSLGIDIKSTVLLLLSIIVATLSLGTGRTTVMQGTVHLVIFAVYLFTTIVP